MGKNAKVLYLHIGTPKTATTAIQRFCMDNREAFHSYGYDYPMFEVEYANTGKWRNGHFLLGNMNQASWDFAADEKICRENFEQIQEKFEVYDNIILSDEGVWNHGFKCSGMCWDQIQKELAKNLFTVKIVVYLRRQDEFVYSWWNQIVKAGLRKTSVITWEEMIKRLPVVQLDYYKTLEKIAGIVGKENIIVRRYDRSRFSEGLIQKDFIQTIGLKFSEEYQIREEVSNVSLTKNCSEIKRILNGLPDLDQKSNDLFRMWLREFSLQSRENRNSSMMSEQEFQEFMAEYKEGNRRIAREYLGEERLFEETYQAGEKWNPRNLDMIEDVVKLFGTSTLCLMKKNEELECEMSDLKYKLKHPFQTMGSRVKKSWGGVQQTAVNYGKRYSENGLPH